MCQIQFKNIYFKNNFKKNNYNYTNEEKLYLLSTNNEIIILILNIIKMSNNKIYAII